MSYEKKVQLNLDGNIYYTSQTGNNEKVTEDNSIFLAENIQNSQNVESSNYIQDNEYIGIEIDEDSKNTYSAISNYENIDENELIIKQLEAEISKLESEYEASQKGKGVVGAVGGFFSSCWNEITGKGFKEGDRVELDNKIALLEAAKSDPTKLEQAYKKIMGADLTDELKQSTIKAQNVADNLSKEEKQQIIDVLKEQAASLSQLMQQTKDDQGWFSKTMGGINNVFGFGTNSIKANAKVEEFIEQVNFLNPDDADFAAKYQSLTGEALSLEGLSELSQGVSKVGNSSAAEAIMDYEETQASAKEIGTGIVVGLATAAAIIGLPFTGGMSAVALVGFGAAVGGSATAAINYSDTWFTSKNYSLEQGILDLGGGAINGAVTAMTLGGSQLAGQGFKVLKGAGSAVAKQTAKDMVSGGFKNTGKSAFGSFGKAALRGAKIAAFSSTSNYMLNTVGTNAIYDISGNYTKSEAPTNIVQNEDGTYSVYYELKDSNTGKTISYEIEKVDSISQDNEGNLIKGNILETSRSNNFNFGDLVKQTAISMGSAAVGAGIGKVTNNIINPYATTLTDSVILGNTAEIVSDAALSLNADYLIASAQAGEFVDKDEFFTWDRILGEGRNQIRGLLIGIASSKVQNDKQLAFNAARAGLDGKTGVDMVDIPKTGGDTNTVKTGSDENFFQPKQNDDVTSRTQTDLPTVKLDDTSLPKTQQEVLETAGRLVLEENNPGKAGELLSAYGMSEAEITKFFTEAIKVKQDIAVSDARTQVKPETDNSDTQDSKTPLKLDLQFFGEKSGDSVVEGSTETNTAKTNVKEYTREEKIAIASKLFCCNATQWIDEISNEEIVMYDHMINVLGITYANPYTENFQKLTKMSLQEYNLLCELCDNKPYRIDLNIELIEDNRESITKLQEAGVVPSKISKVIKSNPENTDSIIKNMKIDKYVKAYYQGRLGNELVSNGLIDKSLINDKITIEFFESLVDNNIELLKSDKLTTYIDLFNSTYDRVTLANIMYEDKSKPINTEKTDLLKRILNSNNKCETKMNLYQYLCSGIDINESTHVQMDVLEAYRQALKMDLLTDEETAIMKKLEESLKQVIKTTDVTTEQTKTMFKGFFANNNQGLETTLSKTDFTSFGKSGIALEYSRKAFLEDLTSTFKNSTSEEQTQILKNLGIEIIQDETGKITGYNGIIDLTKLSNDGVEGDVLSLANKFIKGNKVVTGDTELDETLNSLIQGMPEFINIIGKQQHETQNYSVDIHTLTVLQNAMSNFEYQNLSALDKTCLKWAIVLHDIAKSEGVVDEGHAEISSLYARDIMNKFNLPTEVKNRVYELVKNHHWLAKYNTGEIDANLTAALFRRTGDLDIARIMAEADLKGVSEEFYNTYKNALDEGMQAPVTEALRRINSTGQILFTNEVIDQQKLAQKATVEYNGKKYKVINFTQLDSNVDLSEYGFEPGATVENIRLMLHMVHNDSLSNLENVYRLSDSSKEGFLCASFNSLGKNQTIGERTYGVVLDCENSNIGIATKSDVGSGKGSSIDEFLGTISGKNISTSYGQQNLSTYRTKIPTKIKEILNINDSEYAELYLKIQGYKFGTQLDNIKSIQIGNKLFTGTEIKNAILQANDSILSTQDNDNYLSNNEVKIYSPKVNAVVAKVNSLDEVDQYVLDYAQEHNLPIYLLGEQNKE